jgi:nitrogen fixation-related uncharacterized protein
MSYDTRDQITKLLTILVVAVVVGLLAGAALHWAAASNNCTDQGGRWDTTKPAHCVYDRSNR